MDGATTSAVTLAEREAAVQRGCCPSCWHPLPFRTLAEVDVICHTPYCVARFGQLSHQEQHRLSLVWTFRLLRQRVLLRLCPLCGRPRRAGLICGGLQCWHSWTQSREELRAWLRQIRVLLKRGQLVDYTNFWIIIPQPQGIKQVS